MLWSLNESFNVIALKVRWKLMIRLFHLMYVLIYNFIFWVIPIWRNSLCSEAVIINACTFILIVNSWQSNTILSMKTEFLQAFFLLSFRLLNYWILCDINLWSRIIGLLLFIVALLLNEVHRLESFMITYKCGFFPL